MVYAKTSTSNQRAARVARLVPAIIMVLSGTLVACRNDGRLDNHTAIELNEPEKRHAINFSDRGEQLYIELPHMGASLSPRQVTDVEVFLQRYRREGAGGLRLSTPRSPRAHMAAQRSVADIQLIMERSGIEIGALRRARHPADPEFGETIQLAFQRPVAISPQCGDWSENVGEDRERLSYNNFGCATQRNLAKMVANSRDLMEPQPETARSAERRSVQWSEYVAGSSGAGGNSSGGAQSATPAGGSTSK